MSAKFRGTNIDPNDRNAVARFTDIDFKGTKSMTVQADRDEANINKIIARLEKGGTVMRMNQREPFYGDVSQFGDLFESTLKVQKANELFMTYDAELRERFDNDPVKFVEFMQNPDNTQEAIDLGLALPRKEEAPPAPPVPEQGAVKHS